MTSVQTEVIPITEPDSNAFEASVGPLEPEPKPPSPKKRSFASGPSTGRRVVYKSRRRHGPQSSTAAVASFGPPPDPNPEEPDAPDEDPVSEREAGEEEEGASSDPPLAPEEGEAGSTFRALRRGP